MVGFGGRRIDTVMQIMPSCFQTTDSAVTQPLTLLNWGCPSPSQVQTSEKWYLLPLPQFASSCGDTQNAVSRHTLRTTRKIQILFLSEQACQLPDFAACSCCISHWELKELEECLFFFSAGFPLAFVSYSLNVLLLNIVPATVNQRNLLHFTFLLVTPDSGSCSFKASQTVKSVGHVKLCSS